ncbi:MAG: hypothetical protein HC880_19285 [Bacteroidia bacterium]|nr:hypothetical protein [Bacteroidia bacterium]
MQRPKNQDADAFLREQIVAISPALVFIDAPLSLPKVYRQRVAEAGADFFFRQGDRDLKAMSPMFLGGLTARAMKLKADLAGFSFYETYPAKMAKILGLDYLNYKKNLVDIGQILNKLLHHYPIFALSTNPKNWHEVDAILATISAYRFFNNLHNGYGNELEGVIYV